MPDFPSTKLIVPILSRWCDHYQRLGTHRAWHAHFCDGDPLDYDVLRRDYDYQHILHGCAPFFLMRLHPQMLNIWQR